MHNFIKSKVSIEDALDAVLKGSHNETRTFITNNKNALKKLYVDYDNKAVNHELHNLTPYWKESPEDTEAKKNEKRRNKNSAYDLFAHRKFYNDLWEELKQLNNGEYLRCPICGMEACTDLDHFVPRDVDFYPEYSIHYSNLIPTCHTCNLNKSTQFLSSGKQIIFNAYYDDIVGKDIIKCTLSICHLDGELMVTVAPHPDLDATDYVDSVIISTLNNSRLELMKKFQDRLNILLRKELVRLESKKGLAWSIIENEFQTCIQCNDYDFLETSLYKEMVSSKELYDWYTGL